MKVPSAVWTSGLTSGSGRPSADDGQPDQRLGPRLGPLTDQPEGPPCLHRAPAMTPVNPLHQVGQGQVGPLVQRVGEPRDENQGIADGHQVGQGEDRGQLAEQCGRDRPAGARSDAR